MTYRLSNPLPPEPDENLLGLAMRNAVPFRFHDPMRLFGRLKPLPQLLPALAMMDPASGLGAASLHLLGVEPSEAARMTLWCERENHVSILGKPVSRSFVDFRSRAVCPLCMIGSAHLRAVWQIDALPVCPVHDVMLVRNCWKCDKPLHWSGRGPARCGTRRCGADVRDRADRVERVSALEGIRALSRLFVSGRAPEDRHLDMAPGDLLMLAFLIGRSEETEGRGLLPVDFVRRHRSRMPELLARGWTALENWPHGFHRLLDGQRPGAATRKGRFGLRKEFGRIPGVIWRMRGQAGGQVIADEFVSYVGSLTDIAVSKHGLQRYGSDEAIRDQRMTQGDAMKLLDVSVETIMRLAKREDLFLVPPSGAGSPALLKADRVRALKARLDNSMLKQDADEFLAVTRVVVQGLTKARIFPVIPPRERILDNMMFRRSDLARFIARLEASAQPRSIGDRERVAPLSRPPRGSGVTTVDLCKAVLDGRLVPVGIDTKARGLLRILVSSADVARVFPVVRPTMSLIEASEVLGVEQEAVRAWAALGLLKTIKVSTFAELGKRVTDQALADFRRDYAWPAVIARMAGIKSFRRAAERLIFLGVKPVAAPKDRGGTRYLFRRADLTDEIVARLRKISSGPVKPGSTKSRSDLAASVAQSVSLGIGKPLRRAWNGFSDADGGFHLQVAVGSRDRSTGPYTFSTTPARQGRLDGARQPWVALAFFDQDFFLLLPWAMVRDRMTLVPSGKRWLHLRVDGLGRTEGLDAFARKLGEPAPLPRTPTRVAA